MAVFIPSPDITSFDDLIEHLGDMLAARYTDAETVLIGVAARRMRRILALVQADDREAVLQERILWEADLERAAALAELRRVAREQVAQIRRDGLAEYIIATAAQAGQAAAAAQLAGLRLRPRTVGTTAADAVAALTLDLQSKLDVLNSRITRFPDDVYKQLMSEFSPQILLGVQTTRQAQAAAVQTFLAQGIGHINYLRADGSVHMRMPIGSYAEMVGRTSSQRAWQEASIARMQQSGVNLGMIAGSLDACRKCIPWIGAIVSFDGTRGTVTLASVVSGGPVTVEVKGTVDDARAAGWGHPNCFPGFVPVSAPTGIAGADSRWYEGKVVVVHTASGREFTITPNHPVLTTEGWVAAGALVEGQDLLSYHGNVEQPISGRPDHEGVETRIGEVYETLRQSRHVTTITMPGAAEQFHGDGTDTEVEVVLADRLLKADGESETFKLSAEGPFLVSGVGLSPLLAESTLGQVVVGAFHASHSSVGIGCESSALLRAGVGHADPHGLAGCALFDTGIAEGAIQSSGADADGGRQLLAGLSGLVATDQIVEIRNDEFHGHVYNLHTGDGWYTADSIIVHNCRDRVVGYLPGASRIPDAATYDPAAEKERAKQRELEREIRAAKRREASAMNDVDRRRASQEVADAQGAMRDFVKRTGRHRNSAREQLGFSDGN